MTRQIPASALRNRIIRSCMLLLVTWICIQPGHGQTKIIERLTRQYHTAAGTTPKLDALFLLLDEHHSLHRDSLDSYVLQAAALAGKTGDKKHKGLAQLAIANDYMRWGWTDSALGIVQDGLKEYTLADAATREIYFKLKRIKALCYGFRSDYKETLSVLYELVGDGELYKDSLSLGANLNTIGSVTIARNYPRQALEWLNRAELLSRNHNRFAINLAAVFINKANAYKMLGQYDSASFFLNRGLQLSSNLENLNILTSALRVQSDIFMHTGRLPEAENALKELFVIRRKMTGGPQVIVDDNLMLVDFYLQTGQVQKAIDLCLDNLRSGNVYDTSSGKGISYNNYINTRLPYYEALAKSYKAAKMGKLYQETLEKIIEAKDAYYQTNSAEAMSELQTKYDVQKKETTIARQKLQIVRKNNLFYGSIGLILFLAIVSYLGFSNYRKRQQLHWQKVQEEDKRNAAIAVMAAEEKERRRISADLHDNLGAYANAVLYNTELLQQEQDAQERQELMSDLRYASKDIITSLRETIWALKKDVFTAEDCFLRIRNFVQPFNRYYPHINFIVEGAAPAQLSLHGSTALHLVRMVQEAVNNAIKHANASHIIVSGSVSEEQWKIVVEDNGRGFDEARQLNGTEHHGLGNLKERAQAAGIALSIQSVPGRGTVIELVLQQAAVLQK